MNVHAICVESIDARYLHIVNGLNFLLADGPDFCNKMLSIQFPFVGVEGFVQALTFVGVAKSNEGLKLLEVVTRNNEFVVCLARIERMSRPFRRAIVARERGGGFHKFETLCRAAAAFSERL